MCECLQLSRLHRNYEQLKAKRSHAGKQLEMVHTKVHTLMCIVIFLLWKAIYNDTNKSRIEFKNLPYWTPSAINIHLKVTGYRFLINIHEKYYTFLFSMQDPGMHAFNFTIGWVGGAGNLIAVPAVSNLHMKY